MRLAILLSTATLVVACGGQTASNPGGTSGTTDATDGTANTDNTDDTDKPDTTDGSESTDTTGAPGPECTVPADCEAGQLCDCLGRCVADGDTELPPCAENKNCGSGFFCDTCAKTCRKLRGLCEPCETTQECDEGGACVDFKSGGRFCLRECIADPGCPKDGFSCSAIESIAAKQCTPLSGQCATPSLCQADSDCEYGAICNNGKCQPGCPSDDVCPQGQVCAAFRCVAACSDPGNPCPEGQECDEGHCKKEGGCLEPKHCEAPETYCDVVEELCKPGCLQDFDCKSSGKICEDMTCVQKGCTGNFFCGFEQVCELSSGQCVKAEGPHCEADCDPQSDTACGGDPNWCLGLQDAEGNDKGNFCFVGCGPDPKNPCPQGYQCMPLEDQDGNVQGKVCFRDCTVTPI